MNQRSIFLWFVHVIPLLNHPWQYVNVIIKFYLIDNEQIETSQNNSLYHKACYKIVVHIFFLFNNIKSHHHLLFSFNFFQKRKMQTRILQAFDSVIVRPKVQIYVKKNIIKKIILCYLSRHFVIPITLKKIKRLLVVKLKSLYLHYMRKENIPR